MNNENLTHPPIRTAEEARKKGRAGGLKSGAARREKRSMKRWAEIIGEMAFPGVKTPDGKEVPGATADGAMVMSLYRKAVAGDARAARLLMDLRGELVQKVEHSGDGTRPIVVATEEERRLIEQLQRLDV